MTTVGRSRGTPDGDEGWLPPPGHPVSGLVSANTTTSGEEFLDEEVEVWESLRSMSGVLERGEEKGCWASSPWAVSFYLIPEGFGLSGYASWNSRSASSAIPFKRA